jgi:hypothetical protein
MAADILFTLAFVLVVSGGVLLATGLVLRAQRRSSRAGRVRSRLSPDTGGHRARPRPRAVRYAARGSPARPASLLFSGRWRGLCLIVVAVVWARLFGLV